MNDEDKKLSVHFFVHPVENPRKSKEAGRPIYDDVEMVSIMAPGNTKTEYTARAHSMHYDSNERKQWTYAERFSDIYDRFKRGMDEQQSGTPLSEVPFLTVSQKAEMNAMKVYTVEQLAGMADRDIRKKGMGFREHVDAAKAYLDTSQGTNTLASEMAELRRELEELRGAKQEPAPQKDEPLEFAGMADEDLANVLKDAGVKVDGRWKRGRLIEEIQNLQTEAA